MGPNGSGKSTLANVLSGKNGYEISGELKFNGEIFNVGTENLKIIQVADKVKQILENKFNKKVNQWTSMELKSAS